MRNLPEMYRKVTGSYLLKNSMEFQGSSRSIFITLSRYLEFYTKNELDFYLHFKNVKKKYRIDTNLILRKIIIGMLPAKSCI